MRGRAPVHGRLRAEPQTLDPGRVTPGTRPRPARLARRAMSSPRRPSRRGALLPATLPRGGTLAIAADAVSRVGVRTMDARRIVDRRDARRPARGDAEVGGGARPDSTRRGEVRLPKVISTGAATVHPLELTPLEPGRALILSADAVRDVVPIRSVRRAASTDIGARAARDFRMARPVSSTSSTRALRSARPESSASTTVSRERAAETRAAARSSSDGARRR